MVDSYLPLKTIVLRELDIFLILSACTKGYADEIAATQFAKARGESFRSI